MLYLINENKLNEYQITNSDMVLGDDNWSDISSIDSYNIINNTEKESNKVYKKYLDNQNKINNFNNDINVIKYYINIFKNDNNSNNMFSNYHKLKKIYDNIINRNYLTNKEKELVRQLKNNKTL